MKSAGGGRGLGRLSDCLAGWCDILSWHRSLLLDLHRCLLRFEHGDIEGFHLFLLFHVSVGWVHIHGLLDTVRIRSKVWEGTRLVHQVKLVLEWLISGNGVGLDSCDAFVWGLTGSLTLGVVHKSGIESIDWLLFHGNWHHLILNQFKLVSKVAAGNIDEAVQDSGI